MTLWQQVQGDDFTYEAEGRYLAAPDHRLRLDLKVRVGRTEGPHCKSSATAARCAGRTASTGTRPETVQLDGPGRRREPAGHAAARRRTWPRTGTRSARQRLPGVAPLLRTVCAQLQEPHGQIGRWKGHEVMKVTGRWCPDPDGWPGCRRTYWGNGRARACRVFLDTRTLWPYRIEWWGSASPQKRNVLLVQVEYREPVLNQPLPAERRVAGVCRGAGRTGTAPVEGRHRRAHAAPLPKKGEPLKLHAAAAAARCRPPTAS